MVNMIKGNSDHLSQNVIVKMNSKLYFIVFFCISFDLFIEVCFIGTCSF